MPRCYAADGTRAVNTNKTGIGLTGATTIRAAIYHLLLGASGTPADNAIQWLLQRYTAAGTSTAVTPEPLDPADPAALASAGENHTVEPTYTANKILLNIALNQRATIPWYAREGRELKIPATASNGLGLQVIHASYTGNVEMQIHFEE